MPPRLFSFIPILLFAACLPTASPAAPAPLAHPRSVAALFLLLAAIPTPPTVVPFARADTYIPDIFGKRRHISEADPLHEVSSFVSLGLTDYSQADMLSVRYEFVDLGAARSQSSPNR